MSLFASTPGPASIKTEPNPDADWAPGASHEMLALRARVLRICREFFYERNVMEVATPTLGRSGVPDLHLDSLIVDQGSSRRYLQTSPEYLMKRLLAADSGPIYQMGPAYRAGESGNRHNTEFTLLEWYRPHWALDELADELSSLYETLTRDEGKSDGSISRCRYGDLFSRCYDADPHALSDGDLKLLADRHWPDEVAHIDGPADVGRRNGYLDLLFSRGVEPSLKAPTLVFDFPASQAALARTGRDVNGCEVARRFEFYVGGMEIANAYDELNDASELRSRMEENNALRAARDKPQVAIDEKLLAAMAHLPPAAGIALGIDRLIQYLAGRHRLDEVLAFSDARL